MKIAILITMISLSAAAGPREWTFSQDGRIESNGSFWSFRKGGRVDAFFIRLDPSNSAVVLKTLDGVKRTVGVTNFSAADLAFLKGCDGVTINERAVEREAEVIATKRAADYKATLLQNQRDLEARQTAARQIKLDHISDDARKLQAKITELERQYRYDRIALNHAEIVSDDADALRNERYRLLLVSESISNMKEDLDRLRESYSAALAEK